jgi:hypothetical protein
MAFIRNEISGQRKEKAKRQWLGAKAILGWRSQPKIKMGLRARSGDGFLAHKPIRS